jgi:WD40 repeat protein
MSEPTMIQEQRAILRRLRQTTAHHTQLTTAADAQWQEVQRAYEEVRARLAEISEEQALQSAATRPPAAPPGADPAAAFRSSAERALQAAQDLLALLATPSWRQHTAWTAHGRPLLGGIIGPYCVVAFSPDGRLLASGGADAKVKLWEVASGQEVRTLRGHKALVWSVAFSPDGRLLASGGADSTVKIWEVASGRTVRTLSGHNSWVISSVAFSPDGRLLASGSGDNTVKVWEVASGQEVHTLTGHTNVVKSVAFSPNGRLLASGGNDKTVKVWEVASGRTVRTLTGHTDWVLGVAFSPDGRLLASASTDKTVNLWEVNSGQLLRTLSGHTDHVRSVAFSPDGRLLASGGNDKTVKVWEVSTGRLLQDMRWTHRVDRVSFSPDGHWLAVSGETQIQLFQGTWPEPPSVPPRWRRRWPKPDSGMTACKSKPLPIIAAPSRSKSLPLTASGRTVSTAMTVTRLSPGKTRAGKTGQRVLRQSKTCYV